MTPINKEKYQDFPKPISSLILSFISEVDPAEKYHKMLNVFDASIRLISIVLLMDFLNSYSKNEKFIVMITRKLEQKQYSWHIFFKEILFLGENLDNWVFASAFRNNCFDNRTKCEEFLKIIDDVVPLFNSIDKRIKYSEEDFIQLLDTFSPRLEKFLEQIDFIKDYNLIKFSLPDDIMKLKSQNLDDEIENKDLVNSNLYPHVHIFNSNDKVFIDLFPFIIQQRCDKCLGEHYFFLNGFVGEKSIQYVDFEHNHSSVIEEASFFLSFGDLFANKKNYLIANLFYMKSLKCDNKSERAKSGLLICHEKLGNQHFQRKKYNRAISEYQEVLKISPFSSRVLFNLSLTYRKLHDYDAAILSLERLINKTPNYIKAHEILGYLYEDKGNYSSALKHYNTFLGGYPNNKSVIERRSYVVKLLQKMKNKNNTSKIIAKKEKSEEKDLSFEDLVLDLNDKAMKGKISSIVGRDAEISELFEVLTCMKKNNPLVIGEAGVGKTSLVEELARRIAFADVPDRLLNKRILQLRLTHLLAGTKFRGQFEERILLLINELKNNKNSILFIDDLHTIINAGSTKGTSLDITNALKPELAKGEIQIIGVCSFDDYRLYIEKKPAFERRFQIVKVNEPDREHAIAIMQNVKSDFEKFHNVSITNDALDAVIELPKMYLRDRYLPDKAIDLLDRACAMASVNNFNDNEKEENQPIEINENSILKAVSGLTKIPIAKISYSNSKRFLFMEQELKKRVIGQREAIKTVSEVIRTSKMDFEIDPYRPDGIFLFVGPTGVGKTELARTLADFLCGNEEKMLRIDMSEFTNDISTTKLIGITPGYVGYNDRNQLTDHVRNYPFSLILLDEIEKANLQVLNLFLQVFDSGRLTDGHGRTVYFNNVTFVMTSNIGAELFAKKKVGYEVTKLSPDSQLFNRNVTKGELLKEVKQFLPPEFINRIDEIVFFKTLSLNDVKEIASMQLTLCRERLKRDGKKLILNDNAIEFIVKRGYSEQFGARNLLRAIRKLLLDPLAFRSLQPEWNDTETIEVYAMDEELIIE